MTGMTTILRRQLIPLVVTLTLSAPAFADRVGVATYDVQQTPRAGFGCWDHYYTGSITNITDRTVSGSVVCTSIYTGEALGNHIADYSGGSGTLNDGVLDAGTLLDVGFEYDKPEKTQLFLTRNDDAGQPISPVITLHLANKATVDQILIYGGYIKGNCLPGQLTSATIEFGGQAVEVQIKPVGDPLGCDLHPDGVFDLRNTALAGRVTDQVIIREFRSTFYGSPTDQFSITEIAVDGHNLLSIPVGIDVKPANTFDRIPLVGQDSLPVAVLSAPDFDATTLVDRSSLTFGKTGDEVSLLSCKAKPAYVNDDLLPDLVCVFSVYRTGLRIGDTEVVLKGKTRSGVAIEGRSNVTVVKQ